MMDRSGRVFVAGHGGLVGSAVVRRLSQSRAWYESIAKGEGLSA